LKQVYNGIPDWVFEEEIFEDNYALWWSPDGQKLVWGHFNDSNVEFYVLPEYGNWKELEQYPAYQQVRYPKVRGTNYLTLHSTRWITDNTISRFFNQEPML